MPNPGVFIFRSPSDESLALIQDTQKQLETIESFHPIDKPHLTILHGRLSANVARHALRDFVYPLPESANRQSILDVKSTASYSHRIGRMAIVLDLEDPERTFYHEHTTYKHRLADQTGEVPLIEEPHLTLGYVDPEFATAKALEPTHDLIGTQLRFDAIEFNQDIPAPVPNPGRRPVAAPEGGIATFRPGSIPLHFLATLQKQTTQD